MYAIRLSNVIKEFESGESIIKVLNGITVDIRKGELTMLVGPSGCGKTTLISVATGILSTTSGAIELLGETLDALSDYQRVLLRRRQIGFIFQQYNLLPALTAAENAAIPLVADGIPLGQAVCRAETLLESIGMKEHAHKTPRQLSGGQQQRVAIARALVHDPDLIVCDEPTAALDTKTGQAVMEILKDVAGNPKRAVIIVSHDTRTYHYGDRILEMSDGQIIFDGSTTQFLSREAQ